jgi:hypothetical protein
VAASCSAAPAPLPIPKHTHRIKSVFRIRIDCMWIRIQHFRQMIQHFRQMRIRILVKFEPNSEGKQNEIF